MNIRFSYLYRDAGNFKNFGEVVFSNPNNLSLEESSAKIKQALLDEVFFDAFTVGIRELFFDDYDEELDHHWHEFERLDMVENKPNDKQGRGIEIFISMLQKNKLI